MDRQLFVIGEEIWSSIDRDVVVSTCNALEQLNIFKPPFDEFDICVTIKKTDYLKFMKLDNSYSKQLYGEDRVTQIFRFKTKITDKGLRFKYQRKVGKIFVDRENLEECAGLPLSSADHFADIFYCTLLAILSTKNAEKHTELVKKYGPKSLKKPREYRYITTIKIGKITETLRSSATSRGPVRAHLRRGHIRNQRCGEGFKEVKQVFIQPVFVNADDGWIENQRKEYRIKM